MLFNSLEFAVFFPVVCALYFLLPHGRRVPLLLVASCVFYMAFVPAYILILGATILIALASLLVAALFKLVAFIVGAITAIATDSALGEILEALNVLGQTIGSLISLLGIATLFGFIYVRLTQHAATETFVAPAPP